MNEEPARKTGRLFFFARMAFHFHVDGSCSADFGPAARNRP
jgi:hypothetical protein